MSGARSRRKGATGERELATVLRRYWPQAHRTAQMQARQGHDAADLGGLPFHAEVKRQKRPNIRAALHQACRDAHATGKAPVAFTRADHDGWVVTMRLEDWLNVFWSSDAWLSLDGEVGSGD